MLIRSLTLFSANTREQEKFYSLLLGFPLSSKDDKGFSITAGFTRLHFIHNPDAKPYHFAFNIPGGKASKVHQWLKKKVQLLPDHGQEIIDFPAWYAKSIYFYDKDLNIVEFKTREDSEGEDRTDGFELNQVISVGEIGAAVDDIHNAHADLKSWLDIKVYDGDYDKFCALGDPDGMFIVINPADKTWFPTHDQAYASDFDITADGVSFSFRKGRFTQSGTQGV